MEELLIKSKFISKLDLSNRNLKSIPEEVFSLKNLKKLNLSNNKIKDIPSEISNLKNLEVLDISNNHILNFYAKICQLKKLKHLNLNNNKIPSIPKQIKNLHQLRKLSLANNRISNLPEELSQIHSIVSLNISNNPLQNFPESFYNLKSLKHLWISNLSLSEFYFEKLKKMPSLKSVYAFSKIEDDKSLNSNYSQLKKTKGNALGSIKQKSIQTNSDKTIKETKSKAITKKDMIFISYSHDDKDWLIKVQTHLKVLQYQNQIKIEVWDDTKIKGGDEWLSEIEKALNNSAVAILIVSTKFLASEFIQRQEIPELLNNANKKGTKLLSLIVKPCRFKNQLGLNSLQAINDPSNALLKLSEADQEEILVKLTDRVEEIFSDLKVINT
ncbi:MAG: leucine-rich repeat domain-containing protein [Bacteroidota bacterium]